MSCTVTFICEAGGAPIVADAAPGETLVQVAYRAGVTIQQTCGGTPSCTDCRCVVREGIDDGFEPPEGAEKRLLGNVYFITHERLACQALVKGSSCVFVPDPSKRKKKK